MDDVISALGSKIQASTGFSVGIGEPGLLDGPLILWPWRIEPVNSIGNLPRPPVGERMEVQEKQMTAFVLLLSKAGLSCLVDAAKAISDNAVVTVGESRYIVREHDLPTETQIAILGGAGVPMQAALCYTITG
ncbi:MAG: hypothetical protein ACTHJP_12655 [Rhodanobacteraceae bacterium]